MFAPVGISKIKALENDYATMCESIPFKVKGKWLHLKASVAKKEASFLVGLQVLETMNFIFDNAAPTQALNFEGLLAEKHRLFMSI